MENITVIGSISTDFIVSLSGRPPVVGETIYGTDFSIGFGGKGANQAVAAAKLNANVQFLGAVGDDVFSNQLINNLNRNNVDASNVMKRSGITSGSAVISILEGNNSIVYVPGANNQVDIKYLQERTDIIMKSSIVVIQNEIPIVSIKFIIELCDKHNIKILYNPAPSVELEEKYLNKVDYLTPNETEFSMIFPLLSMEEAVEKYPNKLLITLGTEGVLFNNGVENVLVPAFKVDQVIDTTGAGDTFNGALAIALIYNLSLEESIKFAQLASSISITKFGAQEGMPTLKDLQNNINYNSKWNFNRYESDKDR